MTRKYLLPITLVTSMACAGQVGTTRLAPEALERNAEVRGVVYYQPMLVKLTYSFMTRVDKEGKVVGTAVDKSCIQTIQKEELTVIADLTRPMLIRNASGAFSGAKFSVTLANGLLVSVNAEPTQRLSDVLTASSALVKEFGALGITPDPTGACNAGPLLSAAVRYTIP